MKRLGVTGHVGALENQYRPRQVWVTGLDQYVEAETQARVDLRVRPWPVDAAKYPLNPSTRRKGVTYAPEPTTCGEAAYLIAYVTVWFLLVTGVAGALLTLATIILRYV